MDSTELPFILDPMGHRRPLGFLPDTTGRVQSIAPMADSEIIPESDWEEFDEWPEEIEIKDQNGFGACNGHAAATAIEIVRYVAGMPHVPISAWWIYAILCNGIDRGSMILDALELTEGQGAAPESLVKYGIINPRNLTAEAKAAAPRFRVELGNRLTTPAQLGTAIQRREGVNLAVCVGNGFNNLDADGVPTLGRGPCNHAVCCGLGMKKSRNGKWLIKMGNSWTKQWGQNGFCWLPVDYVPTAAYFEAYNLKAIVDDTADNTAPPPVIG